MYVTLNAEVYKKAYLKTTLGSVVHRPSREGVHLRRRWKHESTQRVHDMVRSIWRHIGVHQRTGEVVAYLFEHIG